MFKRGSNTEFRGKARSFIFLIALGAIFCLLFFASFGGASVTNDALRVRLDNGFTMIFKEDHSAPVVSVQVWVKTGSANETEAEAGMTHFIEHMIFKGTPTRKTGEIARAIEGAGGHINAYTSYDRTVYFVEIASKHSVTAFDVLLDALQHSLFDPGEIEREKEVVLEEYRRSLDLPQNRLNWALMRLCFEKHPYGRPIIGYESTIRSFNRDAILKYMDKWYTPQNMVLVAVGDLDAEKSLEIVKDFVKDFPKRSGTEPSRIQEPKQTSLRKNISHDEVQQVYLDLRWHIPSLTDEHIPALDLLETALGYGKTSRLYNRLKMDSNLVHSIDAGAYALADPGFFSIEATLASKDLIKALDAISEEVVKVIDRALPQPELDRAKTNAEADFIFNMESMSGQARALGFFEAMTGDMYHLDRYLKDLREVTAEDIRAVAGMYLRPENLSIGVMAPTDSEVTLTDQQIVDLFSQQRSKGVTPSRRSEKDNDEVTKVTLPNGMRVIVKENHHLPLVSITGAFLGGVRLEGPHQWGVSAFASEMLPRGTKERSASEIASAVESLAGRLETFSGKNSFGISTKFLSKDLNPGLELLADLILNPTFPESELEKVREDILAGIKAKKDRPTAQLFDLVNETVYRQHPYGHPQTGTEQSIGSLTRGDLMTWYKAHALPANFVLAVVGDVRKEALLNQLKELFDDFGPSSLSLPAIPPEPPFGKLREAHLERPGAQTHLVIAYLGTDLRSNDNARMALIETALSGQGGRLFFELRDKKSLAYSVSAFRRPGLETGLFGVYLACDPTKLSVAREAVLEELNKLRENNLTDKELEAAKRYLLGTLQIGLQTNGSQAMDMALDELYGLGYDHTSHFVRELEAVTLDDIKQAAVKFLTPEKYAFVTLGPGLAADSLKKQ